MKTILLCLLILFSVSCRKPRRCIECEVTKQSKDAFLQYTIYLCGDEIKYCEKVLTLPKVDKEGWDNVTIQCYD